MRNIKPILRRLIPALCLVSLTLGIFAGCTSKKSEEPVTSLSQLNDKNRIIGVASDTAEDMTVMKELPLAQIEYFKDEFSAYMSVSQGKIDAYVFNKLSMERAVMNGLEGVRILDETIGEGNIGAVAFSPVSKIPDLENKVNDFLKKIKSDGTIEEIKNRWLLSEDAKMPEIALTGGSGLHLVVGTTGANMPFTYYQGVKLSGYDIELAYRFAASIGATVEFKVYDYDSIIAAAVSGDIDCIFANLFVTPERTESIRFSEPTYIGDIGVMVRDTSGSADGSENFTDFSDLSGKTVSMLNGAPFEDLVRSKVPDVGRFTYFNNNPDMLLALKDGKTDAVLINNAVAELAVNRTPGLALFPKNLDSGSFGFAFAKGDPDREKWQDAYDSISEETKKDLWKKWTGPDDSAKTLPEQSWKGNNGTVNAAVCDSLEPMSYTGEGGKVTGFDIEMILLMAKELDVHVKFTGMEFSAVMSSVQAEKAKIGAGSIIATEERRESVDFIDYYPASFVLIVRDSRQSKDTSKTLDDLKNANIGIVTGTNFSEHVLHSLPDAKLLYFNTLADELSALKSGKLDAFALDEPTARSMMAQDSSVTVVPYMLESLSYGFIFQKTESGGELRDKFDQFIIKIENDGTIASLQSKWFDAEDLSAVEMPDYRDLPGVNGEIRLSSLQNPPFSFLREDIFCGYEIELFTLFCRDSGYALRVTDLNMDALISSVQSGKYDSACCGISITEERKESVYFSRPDYTGGTVLLVLKDSENTDEGGFFASIKESFEKTFIREDRWKLFINGIATTILITVLSILLGTALGFSSFMLCRNGNPAANAVARVLIRLVRGTPVVVLLMILYYIIFGSVAISGTLVSIIGFTLVFGSGVFGMIKSGVGAIDKGQLEAAYTLGFSNRRAFYKVILPQALPHFMPAYKDSITELIKATAIVGYVAVQDLTKIGDIVRSRTYEAFFPLIAVAIIYFVLAALLTFIVNRIEFGIDPKRRDSKKILRGISEK